MRTLLRSAMRTVMCFGTFDLLHEGHTQYLREGRTLGDRLIVVVARDSTVMQVKGHKPVQGEMERLMRIAEIPEVDTALLGNLDDKLQVILEHKPNVLCLGYDQQAFTEQLAEQLAARDLHVEIVRAAPFKPEKFKTSKIRTKGSNSP